MINHQSINVYTEDIPPNTNSSDDICTSKILTGRILTGIKPTGRLHLGNYVGAIKQIEAFNKEIFNQDQSTKHAHTSTEIFLMIPDSHALTFPRNSTEQHQDIIELIASLLSFDLDIDKICIYRQSEINAIFQIYWILNCFCNKGLLNRGHAFKTQLSEQEDGEIGVGLYTYAVLMAADILSMDATLVPIGQDQKQHIEICRDLAIKINSFVSQEILTLPAGLISENPTLTGTDGRKMSKSYNNYIPIFGTEEELRKAIFSVKTNSQGINEPKDPEILFEIFSSFATPKAIEEMKELYGKGIGWKEVKDRTYQALLDFTSNKKEKFDYWINSPDKINQILSKNAEKANEIANQTLIRIKKALGFILD